MIVALRSLSRMMRGSRRWLAASVGMGVAQAVLLVGVGVLIRHAFDDLIAEERVGELALVGAALLTLILVSTGLALWTRYLVLGATKEAVRRLRTALLERLARFPASWYDRRETGTLHSTIVQDSERVDVMSNALAAQLVPALLIGGALTVALLVLEPLLLALVALPVPLAAIAGARLRPTVQRRTRIWQEAFDRFSVRTQFGLRARPLIRAHSAEELELEPARWEIAELSRAGQAMAWLTTAYPQVNGMVGNLSAVVVLVVGGAAVAHGDLSLGSLVSFYALLALLRTQTSIVLMATPQILVGGESLARLQALLDDLEVEPYQGTRRPRFGGSVALRAVHFGYREGEPVLRGVDIDIEAGEHVAVVGANGSGKTTIASLVLGFYRPDQGAVLADGVPYDDLDIRVLRRRISAVPQNPILFPGTIAENIAYGISDSDDARLRDAARRSTADAFIRELPRGYDTPVGDEGALLSGGQRQRIAIARALLREPALLILDEPTTGIDRRAVTELLAALRDLPGDPAVLLIGHDPAVVAEADRVHLLEQGVLRTAPEAQP